MPYEAFLVSSSLKTIFSQGCHNVGAFNRDQDEIQSFILMKTYALNPCDLATIHPVDKQVIKFKLNVDQDTMLTLFHTGSGRYVTIRGGHNVHALIFSL